MRLLTFLGLAVGLGGMAKDSYIKFDQGNKNVAEAEAKGQPYCVDPDGGWWYIPGKVSCYMSCNEKGEYVLKTKRGNKEVFNVSRFQNKQIEDRETRQMALSRKRFVSIKIKNGNKYSDYYLERDTMDVYKMFWISDYECYKVDFDENGEEVLSDHRTYTLHDTIELFDKSARVSFEFSKDKNERRMEYNSHVLGLHSCGAIFKDMG